MALTPTQLDKLPEPMIQLMSELQDEIISDICRRIKKTNLLTPTAEWQLVKANQLTLSSQEVKRRIAAKLKISEKAVKELYTDAVRTAIREDEKIYRFAMADGVLSGDYREKLTNYTRSVAFSNALKKGLKNTNGLMRNLTNSAAAAANRQLSDALDLAYLEVASGAFTPQEAQFRAVKKLGADGIKCVNYKSGRTDQLDVAVRRAVVTGIGKTCGDLQLGLADEMDCQLVEVSSHLGARPSHAEWQGRIYSLVRGHPKYPYFYDATGYGTGDGLCGWNCRHSFFPYFEGLSRPANEPTFSRAENAKVYEDTQRQRGYERAIRKSKRELAALDGARSAENDPIAKAKYDSEFERKSAVLKRQEARLADHLKATGLLPDNSRVRVDGFGRSVSQKAVHAAKRYSYSESGISGKHTDKTSENTVDNAYIHSKEFKDKFKGITGNRRVDIQIYNQAKAQLIHRNGTYKEDMSLINGFSGKVEGRQSSSQSENGVDYNSSLNNAIARNPPNSLISVHNHPTNNPPTGSDIVSNGSHRYMLGVAVTHDGKVFTYKAGNKIFSSNSFSKTVDKYREKGYNEFDAIIQTLKQYEKEYGIEWSER